MATKPNMKRTSRPDDAEAFLDDVGISHERLADDDAEAFGEEFIASATSGEFIGEDARNELANEELGWIAGASAFDSEEDEIDVS